MNPKIILLVEDNPSDVDLTKRALSKNHVANELVVVEDGQEALDFLFGSGAYAARDTQQMPTLILLDIKLPKVDGLEVLESDSQRSTDPAAPGGHPHFFIREQDIGASYDLGVNSYIRKPVDFLQFAQAIQHLDLYWLVLNEAPPKVRK